MTEHRFTSWDGTKLFYRAWLPATGTPSKAVLLFHRGHEHSGRWDETARSLNLGEDFAIFAWDQRGHGNSPGDRGAAENIAVLTKDADAFARHITSSHGIPMENVAVVAHSVGAVVAAAWVHDFGPPIRSLVLATPALRVKLYVPFAVPLLRLKERFFGPGIVKSYVKARMLTHDHAEAQAYQADTQIFRQISVKVLLDLHDTGTRLLDDAGAIDVPTLLLVASNDWVVKISAQQTFFRKLGSRFKQMEMLNGFYHAVFHEKDRAVAVEKIRTFILRTFADAKDEKPLLHADESGFTRTEYDLLRSPGALHWKLTRLFLNTIGRLSDGVTLGWDSGFDSGTTLDYVYENQPRGSTFLGRMIDRNYLNSIGWRGIRIRRQNLQSLLSNCIKQTHADGKRVHILDIATGAGRYVLETMKAHSDIPTSAILRDYKQANLDAAKQLAEKLGITTATIAHGDAFDRQSLGGIEPKPTIAIASGIYELFPENEPVLRSLNGIADALEPGGHLIYTNQPWHPQVEFIARVLQNREGNPWIMRRRTQAEMDALVRSAGFEKLSQEIDPFGIFTVSIARKIR